MGGGGGGGGLVEIFMRFSYTLLKSHLNFRSHSPGEGEVRGGGVGHLLCQCG